MNNVNAAAVSITSPSRKIKQDLHWLRTKNLVFIFSVSLTIGRDPLGLYNIPRSAKTLPFPHFELWNSTAVTITPLQLADKMGQINVQMCRHKATAPLQMMYECTSWALVAIPKLEGWSNSVASEILFFYFFNQSSHDLWGEAVTLIHYCYKINHLGVFFCVPFLNRKYYKEVWDGMWRKYLWSWFMCLLQKNQ